MIGRMLTGATVLVAAVTTSQLPEFAQQYRQRLGGAVDELRTIVQRFDADAQAAGMDRTQALDHHLASTDQFFKDRGLAMQSTLDRFGRLTMQARNMADGDSVTRLVSFASSVDRDLANATLNAYEPALPVTTEGGILATLGAFLGWMLARLIGAPKRMLDRKLAYRRGEYRA